MPRTVSAIVLFLIVLAAGASAQEPASQPDSREAAADSRVSAVDREFNAAHEAFLKEYLAAKTDEEKSRLLKEKVPKPEKWFPVLYALAKAEPGSEAAEQALLWIVAHGTGRSSDEALDLLARDHSAGEGVAALVEGVADLDTPKAEEFLKTVESRSPDRQVKGRALYARARLRRQLGEDAARIRQAKAPEAVEGIDPAELARLRALDLAQNAKEVERLLVEVAGSYGEVETQLGGTLGERASADLFEIRNLAVGKVAPEIAGEDVFGKPLKLSDFKGKVVVLDFWGHW